MKYHIWTTGCQMNVADSQRVGSELEKLGYHFTPTVADADVIVLNTCVVRQSAENKAYGFASSLKPLKTADPHRTIALMGCMVGVRGNPRLKKAFPHIDVFMPPSEPGPLVNHLLGKETLSEKDAELKTRYAVQDGDLILPMHEQHNLVTAHVPVVYGCSHVCTYCIIPARRGIERSRPVGDIAREVRSLVAQGVKEVTLLGQIVDRYGFDVPDGPRMPDLLRVLNDIDGLERIRFLTSHPNYMSDELLETVAALPKVCEHIEVPIQAGHDEVLAAMKREYTVDDYRRLIDRIRRYLPDTGIATDIIVGFPGETEAHFQGTLDLLAELKMDVCHSAMYSPREGTVSAKIMADDVPPEEKKRRLDLVNQLQEEIVTEINEKYMGKTVEVLVEDLHRGKWKGRTRTNKLVFFEDTRDLKGQRVNIDIEWAGPWSMRGKVSGTVSESITLTLAA